MADGEDRLGPMIEHLSSQFDLVIEAVSGWRGQLDSLREEMRGQFAEVGKQIRFLSDQIAENRGGLESLRGELSAEMVRLGEALGATRVEFREGLQTVGENTRNGIASAERDLKRELAAVKESAANAAQSRAAANQRSAGGLENLRSEISSSADALAKQLRAELKQTNKTLSNLSKKFDRFDDRVSVQVKDQEQRLRKVERRARG
ncbi:MAG TPA: hypothetical protein VMB26_15520 [Candidatus Binataceae bacterium]|nr:hypothetical protein [Candidatus Binataceae bacterium]